jgi:Phytanoyl-CoA dioxygenase (PhyH)
MDVSSFRQHGYQVLRGVIDQDAIAAVGQFLRSAGVAAVDSLCQKLACSTPSELGTKIGTFDDPAVLHSIDSELRWKMTGHFPLSVRLSEVLWTIPRQNRLRAAIAAALEDDELFMHMPPTARFVLPQNTHAGVPPHQDISYNKHMSDFLTAWVPFTSIDDACGGVAVYEGSNRPVELLTDYERTFWLKGVNAQGYKRVHCKIEPGDVLLLDPWIIHESVANVSDRVRYSMDLRFFGSAQKSSKHYLNMQSWTVHEPNENRTEMLKQVA